MSVTETARELDVKRAQQERPKSLQEDTKVCSFPYRKTVAIISSEWVRV
jgi:hypothetical protein